MRRLLQLAQAIDRLNELAGRITAWLVLAMVIFAAYNAVVRFLGRYIGTRLASNAFIELQWYLFSLIFLLAGGYVLKHDAHVRVDSIYSHFSRRTQAWIDLAGTVLFLLPFSILMLWLCWPSVVDSWRVLEGSPDPGGLPRYPIKTALLPAFLLVALQGVAQVIKNAGILHGDRSVGFTHTDHFPEGM